MGIALATMGVFAPTRKRTLVKIAPRALIAANMASLMTASIAGITESIISTSSNPYFSGLLYEAHGIPVPMINPNSTLT